MIKIKVLIIEDEEITRKLLKRVINKEGYVTIVASDGYEGLNLFRSEKPDIVITDIKMPRIDGMEVMHTVKDISPSTEVILITAYGDYNTAIVALQEGAIDYLKKPVDLEQLVVSLGRAREKIVESKKVSIKPSLLILEDDENARSQLDRIFKKEGYKVYTGTDGKEGIKIFSQNKIDILLIDIKMPQKNGMEVLHEVKKVSKDCEAIMITGYGDENTAIQAMHDGAINYIHKPIDLDQLIITVQKALEKLQLQRAYLYKARELELSQEIIIRITEQKEFIIELRDYPRVKVMENIALNLINTIPIPFILIDKDMNVNFVNKYFVRLYGYTPKQIKEDFIKKSGLKSIGIEKVREEVCKIFKAGELRIINIDEKNKIVMIKVSLVTYEGKEERVLIIIGGGEGESK